MINIFDMVDEAPQKSYDIKGVILYGPAGFLKKAPEKFNRKEKLSYIESAFGKHGPATYKEDPFIMEIRCSRGLSSAVYNEAKAEGLRLFELRSAQHERV
jgi:hypothetical protein